LAVKLRPRIRQ